MNDSEVVTTSNPLAAKPEAIAEHPSMTKGEKRRLLKELKYDLIERQTATSENMPGKGTDTNIGDLLQRVNDALEQLH